MLAEKAVLSAMIMYELFILWTAVAICISASENFPGTPHTRPLVGHLQRIGNQKPLKHGEIDELHFMPPATVFYRKYWIPAKPVIFKGVLRSSRAMKNWINDSYMSEKYGSTLGLVDRRTEWTRGGVESPPRSVMSYNEFLRRLPNEQVYWDDQIPQKHEILKDIPFPLALGCNEIMKSILYLNLMVNPGNVSYVLHSDFADNFFHLIAGEKTWLIANSTFRDSVYMGQNTQARDMSPVTPDSVDLVKFPKMAEVDFHEISLIPGDILYIPRDWPHFVRSKGAPNVAMNIWFGAEFVVEEMPKKAKCKSQLTTATTLFKERDTTIQQRRPGGVE